MAANPLVSQGVLNRLRASVTWNSFPSLNVTPSFLNREGIRLAFEGNATQFLPTQTGAVTSPEPYQMISLTINLLKTQGLSQLYEAQRQSASVIGNGVVRPDTTTLAPYDIYNCGIMNVRELAFSGEDAGYSVSISGYILLNSSLWA
jgi:hypothetical protein